MTLGIPCNSCSNGSCGSCVAEKLETMGFIDSAKYHCSCANKGHHNNTSRELPHKTIFKSKTRDTDTHHPDDFEDDES